MYENDEISLMFVESPVYLAAAIVIGKLKCDPQTHAGCLIKVGPLAAKNLIAGNVNGTSDPYALVTCGTEKRFRIAFLHP